MPSMPSMYEIYANHSYEYDDLISHEDYERNLFQELNSRFDFTNKTVIEFGVGTGRVTALYIEKAKEAHCFDRSNHMMERARSNLKSYHHKISFSHCDNLNIKSISQKADFVIEGWSFGHTVGDRGEPVDVVVKQLVEDCLALLHKDGHVILIESLGSNTPKPVAPSKTLQSFYDLLENQYGFEKRIVSTDYRFDNVEEATRIFSFFFGDEKSQGIKESNQVIIPEFTGIWIKRNI